MGKLEKQLKSEVRRTKINKAIFAIISSAGIFTLSLLAPNALSLLRPGPKNRIYRINNTINRLIRNGYIDFVKNSNKKIIVLTEKGERTAVLMGDGRLKLKIRRNWDKKWRMIVFDISEKQKSVRERIRITLSDLGFFRLQDSVWVFPYDCEDLIAILKIDYKIGKQLLYVIADKIENDDSLKTHFNLN